SLTAYKIFCNDTNTLFEEKSFAFQSNIEERNLLNTEKQGIFSYQMISLGTEFQASKFRKEKSCFEAS
uniref:Uncharacterized protein n=1 Tax=Romanomermis culicivorax TaxID=13658 RepID=A0A915IWX3_ROMCU